MFLDTKECVAYATDPNSPRSQEIANQLRTGEARIVGAWIEVPDPAPERSEPSAQNSAKAYPAPNH